VAPPFRSIRSRIRELKLVDDPDRSVPQAVALQDFETDSFLGV
jgi:hypothetical protein